MMYYIRYNNLKSPCNIAFDPIFASTSISEIGLQFEIYLLSFPFFSITLIIACFCEFDNSPWSKAQFRLSTSNLPKIPQNVLYNSTGDSLECVWKQGLQADVQPFCSGQT